MGDTDNSGKRSLSIIDAAEDFELMDEFLFDHGFDCSDLLQPGASTSASPFGSCCFANSPEKSDSSQFMINNINQNIGPRSNFSMELQASPFNLISSRISSYSLLSADLQLNNPRSETELNWANQQRAFLASVQQRLIQAMRYIRDSHREGEVLVQVWAPSRQQGRQQVLATSGQPFSLDSNCQRLVDYRNVSTQYQFLADENSHKAEGMPGRVFLEKMPEWTPDVRYFNAYEYPRLNAAYRFDVRGTVALPIFERNGRSCLGVLEVVMTRQKINYSADVENICKALQAVDLRSSEISSVLPSMVTSYSYTASLPEIQKVLRVVCDIHRLPLAQTWISCIQHGKKGSRHSEENYKECVSTLDEACYIRDQDMLGFNHACSEHHLFRGQGVAGKAFLTNQPCFSPDITNYGKVDYPLAHYAKMFNLHAAVAIRLRSIYTGKTDFVLEFFLPTDCLKNEQQRLMLNFLSNTIQQVCQSLRVITDKELEEETVSGNKPIVSSDKSTITSETDRNSQCDNKALLVRPTPAEVPAEIPSRFSSMMEPKLKEPENKFTATEPLESKKEIGGNSVPGQYTTEVLVPAGYIFSGYNQHDGEVDRKGSFSGDLAFSSLERPTIKKRTKIEKNVSLEELRKYFAGNLKDAAENLGVCPTTLKRICRQHGISRWPSRKIKKVGHSLRKLQAVIDSVHGAESTFQLSSLYENFNKTTLSDSNLAATLNQNNNPEFLNVNQQQELVYGSHNSGSNSTSSSSCSQSSTSNMGCSSGLKLSNHAQESVIKQEISTKDDPMLLNVQSQGELHLQAEEVPAPIFGSQSQKSMTFVPSSESPPLSKKRQNDYLKIKATLGEEKVIFRLQPSWGFLELKLELGKRFGIVDANLVDLKYLDDDSEWVLLTCDADLHECIDIYKSLNAHTIKLSIHYVPPTNRSSLGSTRLS